MKNIFKFIIPAVIIIATQFSCGNNAGSKSEPIAEQKQNEEAEDHHDENIATLTSEQMKSIGIETGRIEQKQLTASIRANGALRVPNQNKASVNSLYSGIIKSLLIQPGDIVKKGATIATIANPDFIRVQEEYLSVSPKLILAEQEYSRQKELNEGNAGALKNLQAAESELRRLKSLKSSLEEQIRLMGINPSQVANGKMISVLSLRAPIGGIVSKVSVKMGTYVDLNTTVAEIVDNSQLHLDLFVYEKDLPKLKNNQRIHFTLTNNPGKEYDAEIYSLGSTFEDESKAVSVHARVNGDKTGLIDGMNITALISLDKITTPAVPTDAIVTYKGQDYIFIVKEEAGDAKHDHANEADHDHSKEGAHDHDGDKHNHSAEDNHKHEETAFEKIPVARGTSDVGYTQITLLKDIPGNAKIVTRGAFFVLAKITNGGEDAHGH